MPNIVTLVPATEDPPSDLADMLLELGAGEAGFGGTPFGTGDMTLEQYLAHCRTIETVPPAGWVPQTVFWIVARGTDGDRAAGMLKMRDHLNDALRIKGGHIGYYIARWARSRGYATQALALALTELRTLGADRAMLTTNPSNAGSIKVIEHNNGVLTGQVPDPDGDEIISQYWIEL